MKKIILILSLALVSVGLYFLMTDKREPLPEISGIYLPKPEALMPFALTQTNGTPFTDQDLREHWSLVFFGFTYCPDICPTTLAMLNGVKQNLEQQHPELPPLQVVFVSVDPERDNLAQLDKYTHYFNPSFIGVTGETSQLKTVARQLGVVFDKVTLDPKQPEQYLMEHSTSLALINPEGQIQAIFTAPHEPAALAQDIAKVIKP